MKFFKSKIAISFIILFYFISYSVLGQIIPGESYSIINTYEGAWKGASLSWDTQDPHPMVSVKKDDPVFWKFQPVSGKSNTYKIISTHAGKWQGASLSWDNGDPHPMISLEFDDPVEWQLAPVSGKSNTYKIINTHPSKWKGASISWDGQDPHPMASLEFDDPVEWLIVKKNAPPILMLKSIQCIKPASGIEIGIANRIINIAEKIDGYVIESGLVPVPSEAAKYKKFNIGVGAINISRAGAYLAKEIDKSRSPDQLYILVDNKKQWPGGKYVDVRGGNVHNVNLLISRGYGIHGIQLMEYDSGSGDDTLGGYLINFNSSSPRGSYTVLLENYNEDSSYLLTFEVQ